MSSVSPFPPTRWTCSPKLSSPVSAPNDRDRRSHRGPQPRPHRPHRQADAVDCAIAIRQRLARQRDLADLVSEIRIGVHEADALMSGNDFAGLGVHEARANRSVRRRRKHPHPRIDRHRGWRTYGRATTRGRVQRPWRSDRNPRGPMAGGLHRDFRGQRPHVGLTCPGPSTERVLRTFTEPGQLQRLAARQKGTAALGLVGGRVRPEGAPSAPLRRRYCGPPLQMWRSRVDGAVHATRAVEEPVELRPGRSLAPPRAAVRCGEQSPLSPGGSRSSGIGSRRRAAQHKRGAALRSASERAAGSIAKRVSTARAAPVDWCASAANRSIPASSLGARRGPAAADVVAEHHAVA